MTSSTGARRASAFTYLEIVLVLGIVAVTAALVLPQAGGTLTRRSAEHAELLVRNYLRYARARAIAQRQRVRLAVADEGASYALLVQPAGEVSSTWQPLAGTIGRERMLPRGLTLQVEDDDGRPRRPPAITFLPHGGADAAVLVLTAARQPPVRIVVDPVTGDFDADAAR